MLFRNSVIQALMYATVMAGTLALYAIIARTYSPFVMGQVAFWLVFFRVALSVADAGVSTLIKRDLAACPLPQGRQQFSTAYVIKLFAAAAIIGAISIDYLAEFLDGYNRDLGMLIGLLAAVRSISELGASVYVSHNNFIVPFVMTATTETASLICALFLARAGFPPEILLAVYVLVTGIGLCAISFLLDGKYSIRFSLPCSFSESLHFLRRSFPVGVGATFNMFAFKADTILLGILTTPASVGIYNAAYNLAASVRIVGASVANAALPILGRRAKSGEAVPRKLVLLTLGASATLGALFTVIFWFSGRYLLLLIFGPEFGASGDALIILSISIVFNYLNMMLWIIGIAFNKASEMAWIITVGAMVNLLLNLVLIKPFDYLGCAWATVITEILITVLYLKRFPGLLKKERSIVGT